jgi:hypothetical protein
MHHPHFSSGEKHGSTAGGVEVLCGRCSMKLTPTWSSLATSTTTSASPRRTRRGGQTPREASVSSWWALAEYYLIRDSMENTEINNDQTDSVLRLKLEETPTSGGSSPWLRELHRLREWRVQLSVQSPLRLWLWTASQACGPITPGLGEIGACGDASGSGSARSPQPGRR